MSNPLPQDSDGQSDNYPKDQVVKIVNSVLDKARQSSEESTSALFRELEELHDIIEKVRVEVGNTRPADIKHKHIPTATDELDAVVEATAEATGEIMDACDKIQENVGKISGEEADNITNEVMKIYEACSFQDITGQRISKVVKTLQDIDEKVEKLMKIMGGKIEGEVSGDEEDTRTGDERLLNGPQLPNQGVTQDDIDKLLAEFDN